MNTEEYQSDFDYKVVVLPTLWDLVKNSKPISTVVDFEGGHIDIKDIRVFMDTVIKMNPSYMEMFFTPYRVVLGEGKYIMSMLEDVPDMLHERGALFAKACYGMFLEKEKAMCHPYPTLAYKIEKWGYDGKQVHHMYRLLLMLRDFERTGTMVLLPPSDEVEFLLDLKMNKIPLEEVKPMIEEWKTELNEIRVRLEDKYKDIRSDASNRAVEKSRKAVFDFCNTSEGKGVE